jgi:hypothetical protein
MVQRGTEGEGKGMRERKGREREGKGGKRKGGKGR